MSGFYTDAQMDARAEYFAQRRVRLAALALKYWIPCYEEFERCDSAAAEDMWQYLHGDEVIEQWAAVTMHDGDSHFVKTFPNRRQAEEHSVEYVSNDIFAESPVAIADLDDDSEPWGKLYPLVKLIPVFAS